MLITQDRENYWMLNWLDKFMEGHQGFICGGCFKNIFSKEKAKDLDIFFKSREDFEDAVEYYDSKTEGCWIDGDTDNVVDEENAEYRFLYENPNVKAYVHKETGIRIELCCKIFGTAEEVLNQFDFTIVKFAYYKEEVEDETGAAADLAEDWLLGKEPTTHIEYKILMHDKFFEHLHMKRLVIDDEIMFAMSTLERMFRYAKYGYFPCKETKMKIIRALRDLDEQQVELSENLYDGMD